MRYLLDTNTISEPFKLNPNRRVVERLMANRELSVIAAPVWHELMFGCYRMPPGPRRSSLEGFLFGEVAANFAILAYDIRAAEWHALERTRFAALKRTAPILAIQIAAIAAVNGLIVVTRNVADFSLFQGIQVENWWEA